MNIRKWLLLIAVALAAVCIRVGIAHRSGAAPKDPLGSPAQSDQRAEQKKEPAAQEDKDDDDDDDEAQIKRTSVEELKQMIAGRKPVYIIDARSQPSYDKSDTKIKGAVRMPYNEMEPRLKEIPRDKEIILYCT